MKQWLAQQVEEHGAKALGEALNYDAANLAKVLRKKRGLPITIRNKISQLIRTGQLGILQAEISE